MLCKIHGNIFYLHRCDEGEIFRKLLYQAYNYNCLSFVFNHRLCNSHSISHHLLFFGRLFIISQVLTNQSRHYCLDWRTCSLTCKQYKRLKVFPSYGIDTSSEFEFLKYMTSFLYAIFYCKHKSDWRSIILVALRINLNHLR